MLIKEDVLKGICVFQLWPGGGLSAFVASYLPVWLVWLLQLVWPLQLVWLLRLVVEDIVDEDSRIQTKKLT